MQFLLALTGALIETMRHKQMQQCRIPKIDLYG